MSFELSSFSPEFFFNEGEPYDADSMPSQEPTSVWQAINSMDKSDWDSVSREVFGVDAKYMTPETVLDKIRETDTVTDLRSPVEVWIDKDGRHTIHVYERSNNPRRKRSSRRAANARSRPMRRKKKRNPQNWTPVGIIGDVNPIEHWGGIIYETPYGHEMLYFQETEGTVYVHRVDIPDDVVHEVDWADWDDIASFVGTPASEIKAAGRGKDLRGRAQVIEAIASYHGWSNFDDAPETLTLEEAEAKYGDDADTAHRQPNPSCRGGQLLVKRKGYTREDGTKVRPTSFCIRDRGKKGRGPDIVPDLREGKLGGDGYTKKPTAARRKILMRCVKQYGYRSCLGSLQYLLVVGEREWPKSKLAKVESDKKWLMKSYGGPGSFGPEDNPRRRRLANRMANP